MNLNLTKNSRLALSLSLNPFARPPQAGRTERKEKRCIMLQYMESNITDEGSQKWELETLLLCLFPLSWGPR